MFMEMWQRFIDNSSTTRKFLDNYVELRKALKGLGHTEKSIAKITNPTRELMILHTIHNSLQDALYRDLKSFGFDISWGDYIVYLIPKLNKIDELIPLNDGDYQGDDTGDEDY